MKAAKKYSLIILVFLLVTAVFFYYGHCKAGFFIDEVHTYGLSNSHYAPYISSAAGGSLKDTLITRDQLIDYATADSSEILDFGSVYYNQSQDVHPPLYYFIFNAASGFAGETFSKWTGLILDYVIYIVALYILFKLSLELFGNFEASVSVVILYGISTIGISTAVYIRMYVLLMLFTVLLALCALRLVRTGKLKYCILCGITVFLGLFTQYYFVLYAFFLCFAVCVCLICRKKIDLLWKFALSAFAGVALLFILFPSAVRHIFVGNGKVVGGSSVIQSITDTSSYLSRTSSFIHFLTYGLKAAIIVALFGILILIILLLKKQKVNFNGLNELALIVTPAIFAWMVNILICPEYTIEERYIYNIAPIFVLIPGWVISRLNFKWSPAVSAAVAIACIILCKPNNLTSQALEYNTVLAPHAGSPVVYMTDDRFEPLTYDFQQLLLFDSIYATDNTSSAKMINYVNQSGSDEIVVFIDENTFWSSGYNPDIILPELENSTGYYACEPLYSNGFSGCYLLRKD